MVQHSENDAVTAPPASQCTKQPNTASENPTPTNIAPVRLSVGRLPRYTAEVALKSPHPGIILPTDVKKYEQLTVSHSIPDADTDFSIKPERMHRGPNTLPFQPDLSARFAYLRKRSILNSAHIFLCAIFFGMPSFSAVTPQTLEQPPSTGQEDFHHPPPPSKNSTACLNKYIFLSPFSSPF